MVGVLLRRCLVGVSDTTKISIATAGRLYRYTYTTTRREILERMLIIHGP